MISTFWVSFLSILQKYFFIHSYILENKNEFTAVQCRRGKDRQSLCEEKLSLLVYKPIRHKVPRTKTKAMNSLFKAKVCPRRLIQWVENLFEGTFLFLSTLYQPGTGGRLCPPHYYLPPLRIFRPPDSPVMGTPPTNEHKRR